MKKSQGDSKGGDAADEESGTNRLNDLKCCPKLQDTQKAQPESTKIEKKRHHSRSVPFPVKVFVNKVS